MSLPPNIMDITLRDYQESAVTAALSFLNRKVNPLVIAPTGAGKTVIASAIMKRWQIANGGRRVFFVAHRKELIEQAEATLIKNGVNAKCLSVFGSKFDGITEDEKANSLVVFDEAHHALAQSWKDFNAVFTGMRVAITATPDRMDRQRLEEVGFELAYEIAIRTLIEAGHLVKPLAQKMKVEMSMIRMKGYDDALEAIADSVVEEMKRWDRKRAIAFMPTVECSERFVACLRSRGITAGHVDGTSGYLRKSIVERYRAGEIQVLCNVNLFTEGFDAPETDTVILLRPTQSRALWVQMIGRGLRKAEGKTDCLILDPMWISGENSFTPADAFTVHPMAKGKEIPDSHDPLGAAEMADRDAEQSMLKRIAIEEKRSQAKEAKELGLVDLSVACACFGFILPDPALSTPMSEAQKLELARFKVYARGLSVDQASWMISRLKARERLGLATVKQIRKLRQFGLANVTNFTIEQASKAISSDWRMKPSYPNKNISTVFTFKNK